MAVLLNVPPNQEPQSEIWYDEKGQDFCIYLFMCYFYVIWYIWSIFKSKIVLQFVLDLWSLWMYPPALQFITIGKLELNYVSFEKHKVFMNLFLT